MSEFVEQNPRSEIDTQVLRLRDHRLTRVNLYGVHPADPGRRMCVIGLGGEEQRAKNAAEGAWFDYRASLLFTSKLDGDDAHVVAIRRRVPWVPPQRAETVGVAYDVDFMRPLAEAAVARNIPTLDECLVAQARGDGVDARQPLRPASTRRDETGMRRGNRRPALPRDGRGRAGVGEVSHVASARGGRTWSVGTPVGRAQGEGVEFAR